MFSLKRLTPAAFLFMLAVSLPASAMMMEEEPEIDFSSPGVPLALGLITFAWLVHRRRSRA